MLSGSDVHLSSAHLKQQISKAVEDEIQNELKEAVVSDEEYLECAHYCWQRFYSCCVQYHVTGLKPLGLLLLETASSVVLLKKSMISFLRPLDILEHLCFQNDVTTKQHLDKQFLLAESEYFFVMSYCFYVVFLTDVDVTDDVIMLFKSINYLDQQMSDMFVYEFEKELAMLKAPDVVMGFLLEKIKSEMDNEVFIKTHADDV